MISGLVLKYLNGECFVIRRGYETTLPVSTSFCLTVPVEVFNRVQSEKQYYEIDGGHFGAIYPHTPLFYEAIAVQSAFIKSIT